MRGKVNAGRGGGARHGRRRFGRPGLATTVALLGTLLVGVPLVSAAVVLRDDRPTVTADQRLSEDAYLFGDEVTFNGQSTRDVLSGAMTFHLGDTATVGGDVDVAASDVRLGGTVERSVRVAAREVIVSGSIGGDLVVAAQTVTIRPGARIAGDLILAAADATVQGAIGGEIRGNAGDLTLRDATVGGGVAVHVDDLALRGTTAVSGPVRYESDDDLARDGSVTVSGPVTREEPSSSINAGDYSVGSGVAWSLVRLLSLLVTGLVVVLVAPRAAATLAEGVRRRFPVALVAGIALLILVPIVAVALAVTLLGIPVSLVLLTVYGLALYLSQVVVGLALGRAILPRSWRSAGRGYNLLAMALGVTIIGLVRVIPVPFVGTVVAVVVAVVGLGALFAVTRLPGRSDPSGIPTDGPSWGTQPGA